MKLFLKFKFVPTLFLITILGLSLRFVDYDRIPPFGETFDEFHYAWAGLTWITTGTPVSWSWLNSYKNTSRFKRWGQSGSIVSPMLEKPPLFVWLSGLWVWIGGARDIFDVRLHQLRILPLFLSIFSILGTGILARKIFSNQIALLSAFLYATVPTVVLANRLSLTENLLTPITLGTLAFIFSDQTRYRLYPIIIGIGAGLAAMTKQSGLALFITLFIFYAFLKKWRIIAILIAIAIPMALIYPLIGYIYNWQLYLKIITELRTLTTLNGLPEYIFSLFRFPIISCKECIFLDGTVLLGYILLLSGPLWLPTISDSKEQPSFTQRHKNIVLLGFPLVYIVINSFINSGSGPIFYGWYQYPLLPFLMILTAKIFMDIWNDFHLYKMILLNIILGSAFIRLLFLFLPIEIRNYWQHIYLAFFLLIFSAWILPNVRYRKLILSIFFICFTTINIYTVIHLGQIYPSFTQPLE